MEIKQLFDGRKIINSLLMAGLPALVFYGCSVLILTNSGFTLREILRDPAQQSGLSSFLGFVSNIGVWLWVSSAAICFFGLLTGVVKSIPGRNGLLVMLALCRQLIILF